MVASVMLARSPTLRDHVINPTSSPAPLFVCVLRPQLLSLSRHRARIRAEGRDDETTMTRIEPNHDPPYQCSPCQGSSNIAQCRAVYVPMRVLFCAGWPDTPFQHVVHAPEMNPARIDDLPKPSGILIQARSQNLRAGLPTNHLCSPKYAIHLSIHTPVPTLPPHLLSTDAQVD